MKRFILISLLAIAFGGTALAGDIAINRWTLSSEDSAISVPAVTPCTVAGALYDAGYYPKDLFESDNYFKQDKSIFDQAWTYSAEFKISRRCGKHFNLVFDGLDYYADIFLNGKQLAASDTTFGVFVRRSFDVTSILKRKNRLEVKLRRAQSGDLNIGFVDWNPRPLDESMGIIRPVTLKETSSIAIEDVFVKPDLDVDSFESADLTVNVTLKNFENKPVSADVVLALESREIASLPVDLGAREVRTVSIDPSAVPALHVANPRVWWSWDLGSPEMYNLEVKAVKKSRISDRKSVDFGIRKIESRLTEDGYRQMTLNGRDILIKGAGWTDDIFLRDTRESIELQLNYVKDMNMNLVRFENIWGKDDTVYDLCDRMGLMALVGWSCQWEWKSYCGLPEIEPYGCINSQKDMDLAARYFNDQVIRLHNHPSVIAWMTGSDRIPNPELEKRYFETFEAQDYRPYICSAKNLTSLAGQSGTKMEGPYEYVGPDYWYFDTDAGGAFGWNTETGIGANLPQLESLQRMIPQESLWPLSKMWDLHCTTSSSAMNSTKVLQKTINNVYGGFDGLEDFVKKAHAVDYDGTRAMFEAFRVRVPKTTGIVQWMLNSAWPALYWQQYDWYGVPTAGYYGTKKACEPCQLIYDYACDKVYAVNESGYERDLVAVMKVYDASSKLIAENSKPMSVSYREVEPAFDLSAYAGKPHFVYLELQENGNTVSDNFYCIASRANKYNWRKLTWYDTPISEYADLSFVFRRSRPELRMEIESEGSDYSVTLTNDSSEIAYMNILKAFDEDGNLIVPAYWSDNFFPLMPGQTKTVTCKAATNAKIELK